jgi:hypothetical protein
VETPSSPSDFSALPFALQVNFTPKELFVCLPVAFKILPNLDQNQKLHFNHVILGCETPRRQSLLWRSKRKKLLISVN